MKSSPGHLLCIVAGILLAAGCHPTDLSTVSVTFHIIADQAHTSPPTPSSSLLGAHLDQSRLGLNGDFSFADVARIRVTVNDEASGKPLYVNFDLDKDSTGAWMGTLPFLPKNTALTFMARAYNSTSDELFNGSTDQTLTTDNQTVTLTLAPITNGQSISLPRIVRITLPDHFVSGRSDNVTFAIEANTGEHIAYTLIPASGGGSFLPSSGGITLLAMAGSFVSQYIPPLVSKATNFTQTVTIKNQAGHSVSTTFTTHVVPPGTTQGVKDTRLAVLVSPVIASLSATRVPGTGNVIWSAVVNDDGPSAALSYAWGFTPDGTFDPAPTFTGNTNPTTLQNYTVQLQGTLTLAVSDGTGATTTLNYLLPANQFPDKVVQTSDPTAASSILEGENHTCVVLNNGQVFCWGDATYGQLGYGNTVNVGDAKQPWTAGPVPIPGYVVQLATGGNHTCALMDTGFVRCWGRNNHGQLGYNTPQNVGATEPLSSFGYVNLGGVAVKLAAGYEHTCALMDTGNVRCWGRNDHGQLGYGHTDDIGDNEQPWAAGDVQVGGAVQDLAAGGFHTCALLTNGSVRCWGRGDFGQLGYGNANDVGQSNQPSDVGDVSVGGPVVQISAGYLHTCALMGTGTVRCWGRGDFGQLGYGNGSNVFAAASAGDVNVGQPVVQVTTGYWHTCALTTSGAITCWGYGANGRLGYGNTLTQYVPPSATVDLGGATAFQVSAGGAHTCALLTTGQARCWGHGANGQLGQGDTNDLGDNELLSSIGDINLQARVAGANAACSDATGLPFCTIQAAIDSVANGEVIQVAAGTYTGSINLEGRRMLSIIGTSRDTVILRPTSTLDWNIGGYGSSRQTPVRVVRSRDIAFSNLTFDFTAVRANFVYGVLYWDSTGTLDGNAFENMSVPDSAGGYYEYTLYLRAPDFTDSERAAVSVRNSTFVDSGRVGVMAHGFVEATLQNNTFSKRGPDFGYAIELGSQSTGTISENTISGYDTTAAADGSFSAGIFIENAFTQGGPHLDKPVVISQNTIQGNGYGLFLGNSFAGLAGDVDIQVTLQDNTILDNAQGGVYVADSDRSSGSSVTVTAQGNRLLRNGPFGYDFSTAGDGELHGFLTGEVMSGQDKGILLEDSSGKSSRSLYEVAVHFSRISGNSASGLDNGTFAAVSATNNWWGCNAGPGNAGCDAIRGNTNSSPWLLLGLSASASALTFSDSATLVASLAINSDGFDTSANGSVQNGTLVSFSSTLGTVNPRISPTTGGKAQTTFTAGSVAGTARVSAQVDKQTVSALVTVATP